MRTNHTNKRGWLAMAASDNFADRQRTADDLTRDRRALRTLDAYYSLTLGCASSDLRRPGWTLLAARAEGDPMAMELLFGVRSLAHIIVTAFPLISPVFSPTQRPTTGPLLAATAAPLARSDGAPPPEQPPLAGVAALAPDLRSPLDALLSAYPPERLYSPQAVNALDAIVRATIAEPLAPASAAHLRILYTTPARFTPQVSQWQDWIEPLDEASEMDPYALSLLARLGKGVFVVRRAGRIVAYSGLRALSPQVWEVQEPVVPDELRDAGLEQALLARATRVALAARSVPIFTSRAADADAARIAAALGYRFYGDATLYTTAFH